MFEAFENKLSDLVRKNDEIISAIEDFIPYIFGLILSKIGPQLMPNSQYAAPVDDNYITIMEYQFAAFWLLSNIINEKRSAGKRLKRVLLSIITGIPALILATFTRICFSTNNFGLILPIALGTLIAFSVLKSKSSDSTKEKCGTGLLLFMAIFPPVIYVLSCEIGKLNLSDLVKVIKCCAETISIEICGWDWYSICIYFIAFVTAWIAAATLGWEEAC